MGRILSCIILAFTMVSLAYSPSFASMFVAPKKEVKPVAPAKPKPDPKKLLEAEPMMLAVKHCLALNGIITEHLQLIDAFNNQPDLDNLPENMDFEQRQKTTLYVMGRPDIPDFGFLVPEIWKVTPRNERQKFNAIATLKLAEIIGFRYGGYPFYGNCKAKIEGEITKDKENSEHARFSMPMAFDTKEIKLTYILARQPKYNWQIEDLLVNDAGATNYVKKDLIDSVKKTGLPATTRAICTTSAFSTLECKD